MTLLAGEQPHRNYANDLAALSESSIGEIAHQAGTAGPIDQADAAVRKQLTERAGRFTIASF